jgi:hypothetical protein
MLAALLVLAACGEPLALPPSPGPASDLGRYCPATLPGAAVYTVDSNTSLLAVTVRRAGPLARLGHDHLVASHSLTGHAIPSAGCAVVSFALDRMVVDEPRLLREAGIGTQPSPQAVEGTRKNMLGPVLDAQRYPMVSLHVQRLAGGRLRVAVTMHGSTRWLESPGTVRIEASELRADGTAVLKQSDFGIEPFSVGGGLLSVRDELDIRYHIVARR